MLTEVLPPYSSSVGHSHSMPDSRHQSPGQHLVDTQPGPNGRGSPSLATNTHALDFTQRLERKLAEYNASENAVKRWLFEILCWCVSAICMGAIVAIYALIKDKPMAGTSLLVYTNALGKVASAALIVPTSEALGQLKWNWFSKSRAMWDFEIFDKASRGPLGAILLLFRTKGRSLAALGAILIVLLLAIDTFFQQVVDLPNRLTLQSIHSTLPRVVDYKPPFTPSYYSGFESTAEDRAIAVVAKEFFYGNGTQPVPFGNGTRPDVPLTCPTSNCIWPSYETLAVCSRCTEVSELLRPQYACLNTTVEWSATWWPQNKKPYPRGNVCGYFLNAASSSPVLLSGYVHSSNDSAVVDEARIVRTVPLTDFDDNGPYYGDGSVSFKDARWPILDVLISSTKNGSQSAYDQEAPTLNECILTWCINTINSSYAEGQYHGEVISTYWQPRKSIDPWPWSSSDNGDITPNLIYTQNITLTPPEPRHRSLATSTVNTTYRVNNVTQAHIMWMFDDFFPSFYTAAHAKEIPKLRYKNYIAGAFVQELEFNPWQQPNNLSRHMERLAAAMTNVVRSSASRTMLQGEAYQMEPYISVRWEWLTFPFILLLLSLVFLVSTLIRTSGDGAAAGTWKTSTMPTLIYSLPKETQGQLAPSTWGNGDGSHRKMRIKLLPNLGWRVSGQNQLNSPRLPTGERESRG